MKRTHLTIAVLLLTTFAAAPVAADELVAETNIASQYHSDPSFDAISERDAMSTWQLGAGWQFDRLAGLRAMFVFDTTVPGRLDDYRFGSGLNVQWGRQRFLAAAEWGPRIFPWFRPFVRASAGYSHQFLALTSSGPRMKDHAHDLALIGGGGLEFAVPTRWGSVGLRSQIGYQWQTAAQFDELRHDRKAFDDPFDDSEEDPWIRERADFGTLRTNSIFWDLGLTVRFEL